MFRLHIYQKQTFIYECGFIISMTKKIKKFPFGWTETGTRAKNPSQTTYKHTAYKARKNGTTENHTSFKTAAELKKEGKY
jgi:hypothetical protein